MVISLFLQKQENILQLQNHGEVLLDLITLQTGDQDQVVLKQSQQK